MAALQFLNLPVLTNYISVSDYSDYIQFFIYMGLVSPILAMSGANYALRNFAKSASLLDCVNLSYLQFRLTLFLSIPVSIVLYFMIDIYWILPVIVLTLTDEVIEIILNYYRVNDIFKKFAWMALLRQSLKVAVIFPAVMLYPYAPIPALICALVLVNILLLMVVFFSEKLYVQQKKIQKNLFKKLMLQFKYGSNLLPAVFIGAWLVQFDRIIAHNVFDETLFALYGFTIALCGGVKLIEGAAASATIPYLIRRGATLYRLQIDRISIVYIFAIAVMSLIYSYTLYLMEHILFGKDFQIDWDVYIFGFLAFIINSSYTIYNSYIMYFGAERVTTIVNCVTILPGIIIYTFFLVPKTPIELVMGVLSCYLARTLAIRIYLCSTKTKN